MQSQNPLSATTRVVWEVLIGTHVKMNYAFSISPIGDAALEKIESTKLCLVLPGVVLFVNKSARLNSTIIHPTRRIPAARASPTLW